MTEQHSAPTTTRACARNDIIAREFDPARAGSLPALRSGHEPVRRLRLCYLAETVRTGVGRHLVDLITGIAGRGHEVHLLHSVARADPNLLRKIGRVPGVRCEAFAMRREPHWSDVGTVYALARYLRRWGPFDIIHGHSSKAGVYARLLGTLILSKRVYTPHALVTMAPQLTPFRRRAYSFAERGLSYLSDRIICVSSFEREHAVSLGIGPHRLAVVPHGLSPDDDRPEEDGRERLGLEPETVIIGLVGRLDAQKAPELLVEAAAQILRQHRNVHVIVIGDGPLKQDLVARARQRRIAEAFSWLGEAPARHWLPTLDILAMPSRYEGFSYVLLEALAAGVPIVCTAVGGVAEAVEDGLNGFIVPHDDIDMLARRLGQLVDDRDLRINMGMQARLRSARFSLEQMIDRVEEIYLS